MKTIYICLVTFFTFFQLPAFAFATEIRLSVASSMTDVVRELSAAYNRENPDVSILTNGGSSGALAKQIALGAPVDLFISANTKWMDYLIEEDKIDPHSVLNLAANSLVFIGAATTAVPSLKTLPSLARIALGSPQSVPAGQYARQAMENTGIYQKLLSDHKLVNAKDVRQALLYADRGEVDGAFVYRTDALMAKHAVILFTVPADLHDQINYPLGLTSEGCRKEAALSFYAFLAGPAASVILEKFGFSTLSAKRTASN